MGSGRVRPFPMRSLALAVLALLFSGPAAAVYVYVGPPTYVTAGGNNAETALASCALRTSAINFNTPNLREVSTNLQSAECWGKNSNGDDGQAGMTYGSCDAYPAGSRLFLNGVGGCYREDTQCPAGQEANGAGVCIEPSPCESGRQSSQNLTVGWSNYSASATQGIGYDAYKAGVASLSNPAGSTICNGTCTVTVGAVTDAWHARTPSASGLYRLSADFTVTETGATCSTPSPAADSTAAPPPCPGVQGTVNGVPVCLPSSMPTEYTSPTPYLQGNPTAGSDGSAAIGDRSGGGGGAAGGPSSTGDGDLRNQEGIGLPGGGGGSGGGEGESDGECGFGPNPPCKIDETGTPEPVGEGHHDGKGDAIEAAEIAAIGAATSNVPPTEWSWSFQLPSTCSTINLGAWSTVGWSGAIDVCQFQGVFHDVMSLVWIAAAIFGCIALVGRTLGS